MNEKLNKDKMVRKNKIFLMIALFCAFLLFYFLIYAQNFHSKAKVVLIGIDAGEWDVINPLISKGEIPNFEKLKTEGSYGYLISPYCFSPISWTEIATGKTKEKHGVYDFFSDENKTKIITSKDVKSKRIWNILNDYGRTVGVYNWLITWPSEEVNGFLVSDWLGEDVNNTTFPIKIEKELGKDRFYLNISTESNEILYLINKYNPDFFVASDYNIHSIEHSLWKYWKPEDFNLTNYEEIKKHQEILKKSYQEMDILLNQLEQFVGKDAVIFVVSDHGMKDENPVSYRIDFKDFLKKLDLLDYSENYSILATSQLSQVDEHIPYPYAVDFLFLNASANKTEILNALLGIKHKDTNLSFFSSFSFPEKNEVRLSINNELLKFYLEEDIEKTKEQGFPVTYIYLSLPTEKNFKLYVYEKSGEHYAGTNGVILVKGPMIKQNYEIKNVTTYDILPTILYIYDLPIPKDIDGRVLTEIIKEDYLKDHPILYSEKSSQKEVTSKMIKINETMQRIIEERLKELGYIK